MAVTVLKLDVVSRASQAIGRRRGKIFRSDVRRGRIAKAVLRRAGTMLIA
jgi:hypothetical protein